MGEEKRAERRRRRNCSLLRKSCSVLLELFIASINIYACVYILYIYKYTIPAV